MLEILYIHTWYLVQYLYKSISKRINVSIKTTQPFLPTRRKTRLKDIRVSCKNHQNEAIHNGDCASCAHAIYTAIVRLGLNAEEYIQTVLVHDIVIPVKSCSSLLPCTSWLPKALLSRYYLVASLKYRLLANGFKTGFFFVLKTLFLRKLCGYVLILDVNANHGFDWVKFKVKF